MSDTRIATITAKTATARNVPAHAAMLMRRSVRSRRFSSSTSAQALESLVMVVSLIVCRQ
jgi:hypothetical protein